MLNYRMSKNRKAITEYKDNWQEIIEGGVLSIINEDHAKYLGYRGGSTLVTSPPSDSSKTITVSELQGYVKAIVIGIGSIMAGSTVNTLGRVIEDISSGSCVGLSAAFSSMWRMQTPCCY